MNYAIITSAIFLFIVLKTSVHAQTSSDTLFYESFDDNSFRWKTDTTEKRIITMSDGKLQVRYKQKKGYHSLYTFMTGINTDTFRIKMTFIPDSIYKLGMIYQCARRENNKMSYYSAIMRTPKGYFAYEYVYSQNRFYQLGWKKQPIVPNTPMIFEIKIRGRELDFFVNGEYLFSSKVAKNTSFGEFGWVCSGNGKFAIEEILITDEL